METELLKKLLQSKNKFIFIGETGSGKSELSINFSLYFTKITNKKIHFFDMDQTKPLFRSREVKDRLIDKGITFHSSEQLLDAPTIPHAVDDTINDSNNIAVFDIGGNVAGARCMGQFSKIFNQHDAVSYYLINYYRPFSQNLKHIRQTISEILYTTRINDIEIISNPNLGRTTTVDDIICGHTKTHEILANTDYKISFLTVMEKLYNDRLKKIPENIIKISPYIECPWEKH